MDNNFLNEDIIESPISKSKVKQQMLALQDLGVELSRLTVAKLNKLDLPIILLDAVLLLQKISAHGALKRQRQYVAKLMRAIDCLELKQKLALINGDSLDANKILHQTERWRTELLESDDQLHHFLNTYKVIDIVMLRTLIRTVRREILLKQNKNYRNLFRMIKAIIEENR